MKGRAQRGAQRRGKDGWIGPEGRFRMLGTGIGRPLPSLNTPSAPIAVLCARPLKLGASVVLWILRPPNAHRRAKGGPSRGG